MKGIIEIKQHKSSRALSILFSKEACELIDSKYIVIVNRGGNLIIKRPTFEDRKTYSISKRRNTTFTCEDSDYIIGDYWIDDVNIDKFELNKIN